MSSTVRYAMLQHDKYGAFKKALAITFALVLISVIIIIYDVYSLYDKCTDGIFVVGMYQASVVLGSFAGVFAWLNLPDGALSFSALATACLLISGVSSFIYPVCRDTTVNTWISIVQYTNIGVISMVVVIVVFFSIWSLVEPEEPSAPLSPTSTLCEDLAYV